MLFNTSGKRALGSTKFQKVESQGIFALGVIALAYCLFSPTPRELALLALCEVFMVCAFIAADGALFYALFPHMSFAGELNQPLVVSNPFELRSLLNRCLSLPERRRWFGLLLAPLRLMPVTILALASWNGQDPFELKLLKLGFIALLGLAYLASTSYYSGHFETSQWLERIKNKFTLLSPKTLGEAAMHAADHLHNPNAQAQATIALFAIAAFIALFFVMASHELPEVVTVRALIVGFVFSTWSLWVRIQAQRAFLKEFSRVKAHFQSLLATYQGGSAFAPTSFEPLRELIQLIETCMGRIRRHEEDLARWTNVNAEEARFQMMGELAALVVHDLATPLHVVHFCAQHLRENLPSSLDRRYLDPLDASTQRALDLINALRSYLRNAPVPEGGYKITEILTQILRILETQIASEKFRRIRITLAPELNDIAIFADKSDLMHIFMNVLANSVDNLTNHSIARPTIDVSILEQNEDWVTIGVRDNGTGLSMEQFNALTDTARPSQSHVQGTAGLGLKLVRRLVERLGGTIGVVPPSNTSHGTTIAIRLPMA